MSDSKIVFEGKRFKVERLTTQVSGKSVVREVVRHPGAVTIVPMVDEDHVCLISNFRVAVGQTLIELPAGTLDPGEDPLDTAQRELEEETGYQAARWEKLTEFYLSPGILDECMRLYSATQLTRGEPRREAGEEIENLITPFSDALEMVKDGRIRDAKTIVGLLMYQQLRRG
jgi:ADP-ribose pyrophosphatase